MDCVKYAVGSWKLLSENRWVAHQLKLTHDVQLLEGQPMEELNSFYKRTRSGCSWHTGLPSSKFKWQHFSILSGKREEIDIPRPPPCKPLCDCSLIAVRRLKEPTQTAPAPVGRLETPGTELQLINISAIFHEWLHMRESSISIQTPERIINHFDRTAFQSFSSSFSFVVKVKELSFGH